MSKRVILDDRIITELPSGLNSLKATIKYDRGLRIRLLTQDGTLTFTSDGFRYLQSLDKRGFCGEVRIRIEEDEDDSNWKTVHDGIIHLPACVLNIEPNFIRCPIDDNSFFARINKNKNLKALLTTDRTKNDFPITPAAYDVVQFFRPSTGAYSYSDRWVFPVSEIFRFLIEWMSDGEVGFVSDTFTTGDYSDLGLILGAELRAGTVNSHDKQPEISFNDFIEQISKKRDIMMEPGVDASGKPVIRIEKKSFFYDQLKSSITLDYCKNISRKVDTSRLYAAVRAGSDLTDDSSGAVAYPETTRWQSFRVEQYPLLGQCNVDTELDLVSSYIISSNVIEQIVVNNVTDYDENKVLVQYDRALLKAKQSNWLTLLPPPYFYNEGLKNDVVVENFLSGIPASIANFLGTNNDARFLATQYNDAFGYISTSGGGNSSTQFLAKNDFTGDGFDTGLNYGGTTPQGTLITSQSQARYTAPQGGFYRFSSRMHATIHSHSFGSSANWYAIARRYNAANSVIETKNFFFSIPPGITSDFDADHTINFNFLLNATDYVRVEWRIANQNGININLNVQFTIRSDSFFKCDYTSFGGGVWATSDDADFDAYIYTMKHKMSKRQWEAVKQFTSYAIYFNTDGITNYKCWIESITYYEDRGVADISLSSSHRLKP